MKSQTSPPFINNTLETDFLIKNGNIIFSKVKTMDDIPAGEYYPVVTRDTSMLYPIKRSTSYGKQSEAGNKDAVNIEIEELLESNSDKAPGFVPVHKYFPIEQWNPGLLAADTNIQRFLESKSLYRDLQMDYRRSILLHGDPGTGKSQYLFHLSRQLIEEHNAIVIRIENSSHLSDFQSEILQKLAVRPDRLKVIIIEELADFTRGNYVTMILNLLDNMHFRENVMFLLTTNYPERIPENVVDRPSRLDLLSGVYTHDYSAGFVDSWYEFILGKKITDEEKVQTWYDEIPGKLSPAYMKELFIYSQLLEVSIDEAWDLIKERKRNIKDNFAQADEKSIGFHLEALQ